MGMFPDADRAALEQIVSNNCVHLAQGAYAPSKCTRADQSQVAVCGAHELMGDFPRSVPAGIGRHEAARAEELTPSWCAVLAFYRHLYETRLHASEMDPSCYTPGEAD
jgi:hypothetical protein